MQARYLVACAAAGITVLSSLAGCAPAPTPPTPPPAFNAGTAEAPQAPLSYPAGPYGVTVGSTVENLTFIGYANPVTSTKVMQAISFADFYNPHGRDASYTPASPAEDDRLFPAGSQYGAGKKKPTVLAMDVASVWCGPCNAEAQCSLPVRQKWYEACGGGLFLQLQDGPTVGTPATPKNLVYWAHTEYKETFPVAIDPEERILSTIASQEAFPQNFILDTATMKIVALVAGVPDDTYWSKYEGLLVDPTCPAKQPTCASDTDCPSGSYCSTTCPAQAITCIANACQAAGCSSQ
jgi:hypothetical protein